jgi:putative glutamine amidotransferase
MERKLKLSEANTAGRHMDEPEYLDRPHIAVGGIYPSDRSRPRTPIAYAHAVDLVGGNPVVYSTYGPAKDEKIPEGLPFLGNLEPTKVKLSPNAVGLLLPGGGDISPLFYRSDPHPRTRSRSARRDQFEMTLLEQALERDLPIFAICRGMQLLSVLLGGRLDQHLADTVGRLDHDRDRPRAEPAHGLRTKPGSILHKVLGERTEVNSHHHQGLDGVSSELEEIAWADDGVLEGIVMPSRTWVLGVQWHPEAMAPVHRKQLALFERFLEATNAYAAREEEPARSA